VVQAYKQTEHGRPPRIPNGSPTGKTMKGRDYKAQATGQRPCWDSQARLSPLLHMREIPVSRCTEFFAFTARHTRRRELGSIIP